MINSINVGQQFIFEFVNKPQKNAPAVARQNCRFGDGHGGVNAFAREIIAVGKIFVRGRSLQLSAHTHTLAVLISLIGGNAREDESMRGKITVACVHRFDVEFQICVIVAVIGRLG